jgi:formylglycine-generating enzyme required for sulfatase activity
MPLPPLIQSGLSTLLSDIIIDDSSKAISILKEHFTFRADEITKGYQDSYGYAITAITVGLAAPDQKIAFIQKILHSKITRDFADPIEINYLQPFAQQRGVPSDALSSLRKQFIDQLNQLIKHKDQLFQIQQFSQADLAALVNYQGTLAITQLVLEQMQQLAPVPETLAAFLSQDDLLGKAMLYFFHEIIRKDDRIAKTQAALQREGLAISVQNIETAVKTAHDNLNQAAVSQSSQLVEIAQKLQHLQQAQSAWQTRSELLTQFTQQFPAWRELLNHRLEQLVNGIAQLFEKIEEVHDDIKDIKSLVEKVLAKLMARQNLSLQVKPRDEFTQHNSRSLEIIRQVASQFEQLPTTDPEYSRLSIMVGSALSSTGNLEQAEVFFRTAIEKAHNQAEKALAHFNLFQVELRRKAYQQALTELQVAIEIDPDRYALHDIRKGYYPIERLLGAGGMGCVFLCQNKNRLLKQERVVVKCFWETLKGDINEVFKEPFAMSDIASEFVPKPLDYGYAKEDRAYFVTEYIEGAIDGEAWLKKYGPMDLETTLDVGLQVAKGLQLAHENGIYHLDLKPANLLLKRTKTGITVKIIDFGLSQVATSLGETAKSQSGLSEFGQAVICGTLDYAPPEQQSFARLCKPDAKNDVFAFGATMYRLCTQKRPRPFRERDLPKVQALRDLLCDCVEDERVNRPDSARDLVSQLEEIVGKRQAQKQAEQVAKQKAEQKRQAEKERKRQAEIAERKRQAEKAEQERKRQAEIAEQKRQAEQERKRQAEIKAKKEQKRAHWSTDTEKKITTDGHFFEFETVTVNAKGEITHRERKQARYQTEDLGKGVILEMVYVPGGTFMMGSPENEEGRSSDEGPQHEVTIEPFYMSIYPVTQAQWEAVMGNNPSGFKRENCPVETVSWDEAVAFCQRLSEMTGKRYGLPSEAQWEYGCRAGTTTPFCFGETITTDLANYNGNYTYGSGPKGVYREETTEVGSFPPNAFGLYDMHGNVWEWCADPWHENYEGAPSDGRVWKDEEKEEGFFAKLFGRKKEGDSNSLAVIRGGSWSLAPGLVRVTGRTRNSDGYRLDVVGFRLARP